MAYLIKKYKLGKTSRTQRVTYPKIFFQRLRYFDANEGINPIMVDFPIKIKPKSDYPLKTLYPRAFQTGQNHLIYYDFTTVE